MELFDQVYERFVKRYGLVAHTSALSPSMTSLDEYAGKRIGALGAHFYCVNDCDAVISPLNPKTSVDSRAIKIRDELVGKYVNLRAARREADELLIEAFPGPGFRRMTILPVGIFVGEPEDIRDYFLSDNTNPQYPIEGFGERIGKVELLSKVRKVGPGVYI